MDIFATILTGVLIATATSFITVRLSIHRFRTEKWWERRVDAYIQVIEAFHHSKALVDAQWDAEAKGKELPEDRINEILTRAREANKEIDRAIDLSGFFLCSEARERLFKYRRDAAEASRVSGWHEHLELNWSAKDSCLENLIAIAQNDLRIR